VKNPLESIKESKAAKAVAKSRPVRAIKDVHPIDAVRKSKAGKAVAKSKPVRALKDAHPIDAIRKSRAAKAVAKSKPVRAIARTAGRAKSQVQDMTLDTGDPNSPLAKRTRQQLYNRARELGVKGRSGMSKSQLVAAIRKLN